MCTHVEVSQGLLLRVSSSTLGFEASDQSVSLHAGALSTESSCWPVIAKTLRNMKLCFPDKIMGTDFFSDHRWDRASS